jgi:hypothetical protein
MSKIIPISELNKTTICVQPWFGTVIDVDGRGSLCCEITQDLPFVNIANNSLREFQHNEVVDQLKEEMLAGKRPDLCWRCFSKEDKGIGSLRHTLNYFYGKNVNKYFDSSSTEVVNLEMRLGNVCQLQCLMCHPNRSRKTANSILYAQEQQGTRKELTEHYDVAHAIGEFTWMESEVAWNNIIPHLGSVRRIFINGGEPFLVRQHFAMLDRLVEAGLSKNIDLIYSSNLLAFDPSFVETWKHFRIVSVAISVDDLFKRNHFIRFPTPWSDLETQLTRFATAIEGLDHIRGHVWCTVNIASFAYLDQFIRYFDQQFPMFKIQGCRGIDSPKYLSPSNLPQWYKRKHGERILEAIEQSEQYNKENLAASVEKMISDPSDADLLQLGLDNLFHQGKYHDLNLFDVFPIIREVYTGQNK